MKELPDAKFDWCNYIGQRICFEQNRSGILRYYGKIKCYDSFWLGIELDEATGESDGSFNGVKYFTCEDQHGIFIPESSTVDVVSLTQVCDEENIELGMCEVCVDEKTINPFQTHKISFISTEKENLPLNTYFSNHFMVPMKLPCVLSPLKEESENYIDISDLNKTTVLKCSYDDDQGILMKTFTLKDDTFNVVNDEKVKDFNLTYTDKNDSNLTETDDSLGILPALLNDSPSWGYSTSDAKVCNKNNFSDLADSFSLEKTFHQKEKVDLAVASHTINVKEDSVIFSDVDSPVLDCENLPICASTPKHPIIFTNFNKKSTGLDVPKSCSALAVSEDSTLGHKEQVFNFLDISTVEDFDITFVQPHSEKPCLNTSYSLPKNCSKEKLVKPCEGEITAIVPNDVKAINVENILISLDQSTDILNSTFVHQNTDKNSDFVCETNNGNDTDKLNDVTIGNNLNKTFRTNEEKVTKQKRSSIAMKSDSLNSSEFRKIKLQCTFTAEHFNNNKESLSNECQKKKEIKLQTKLPNSKNVSNTIKKTTNQPFPNKDRFSLKYSQTRKSSSSEPCRENVIKTRQSLSSVSDLKHSVGHSLDDKNKIKFRRSSLSKVENKSYSLLNSTITLTKSITESSNSGELSKNCSTIPDSVKLLNSIGSEKSVTTSDLNSLCEPNVMDISVFLSEEPVIIKPNGGNVTVSHITPTIPFHEEKDSLTFSSEIENKKGHCVPNSDTFCEMNVRHTVNYATVNVSSEPLVTNATANTEESCLELNVPVLAGENDEECAKNVLNESIDSAFASTNQIRQSLNALNSLTVTKKGSYKEFANTLNTQNLKSDLSTTLCSTSKSEDLSQLMFRKSNAGTFGFSKTTDKASSMDPQNLNTHLSTTFCSTSRSEDLSKSIVRKSNASSFGFAKTTDKTNAMKNKLPKLFGLASQSETSKIKKSVRQSTGSISDSTSCSLSSNLRITNPKTSSTLRKHSFNQKDLALLKNSSGNKSNFVTDSANVKASILPSKRVKEPGTSNCVTDSAKSQKAVLASKNVVEARRSNCITDSSKCQKTILPAAKVVEIETSKCVTDPAKGQKAILPSKKGVETGTSINIIDSAKGKKASILQSTKFLEAGTSKCVAVTRTIKWSQQQNLSSALKKESCAPKTSIKCPAVKLTLVNSSKPKRDSINGVCKVNSGKPMSSKLPSSKNNSLMPAKSYLRPNIQPPSSSVRSTVFKREDKNAPSKSNVQRKSAESSGLTVSNIPKQGLGIPKLFNRASTGSEKHAGNVIRKLKSPCQVKKRT